MSPTLVTSTWHFSCIIYVIVVSKFAINISMFHLIRGVRTLHRGAAGPPIVKATANRGRAHGKRPYSMHVSDNSFPVGGDEPCPPHCLTPQCCAFVYIVLLTVRSIHMHAARSTVCRAIKLLCRSGIPP